MAWAPINAGGPIAPGGPRGDQSLAWQCMPGTY